MKSAPPNKRETGFFREVWIQTNRILEFSRSIAVQQNGSLGVKVSQTSNGTLLKVEDQRLSRVTAKRFLLQTVEDDYYVCREWDGENMTGVAVNVAKSHELRRTGWDGETIVYGFPSFPNSPGQLQITYNYITPVYRTAASGGTTEHQLIQPVLVEQQTVIFAIKSVNGTGVEDADEWIEFSARAWAKVA